MSFSWTLITAINYANIDLLSDIDFTEDSIAICRLSENSVSKIDKFNLEMAPRKSKNSQNAGRVPDAEFRAQVEKQMKAYDEKTKELEEQIAEMASKKPESNDEEEDSNEDESEEESDDDNETPPSKLVKKTKEDMVERIKVGIKNWQFSKIKFINSTALAKPHMLSLLNFIKGDKKFAKLTNDYKNDWCEVYKVPFRQSLSARRTYCQQEMRKHAFKLMARNQELPSKEDIERCSVRNVNLVDPKDLQVFAFYWKCVLASHGGKSCWNNQDNIFYQKTPSKLTYLLDNLGDTELDVFTPETEGMLFAIAHFAFIIWPNIFTKLTFFPPLASFSCPGLQELQGQVGGTTCRKGETSQRQSSHQI